MLMGRGSIILIALDDLVLLCLAVLEYGRVRVLKFRFVTTLFPLFIQLYTSLSLHFPQLLVPC
jgi:hypothetical protein